MPSKCIALCKKLNDKQKAQLNRVRRPERGELSHPETITEPKKKDSSSFLVRTQPIKSHGLFVYSSPPTSFSSLFKSSPSIAMQALAYGLLIHVILCWYWINLSLLEKHLAVSLFQINILVVHTGTSEDPQMLQGWWANRCDTYNWAHCCSLLFSLTLVFECISLSPESKLTRSLHLKLSRLYSGSILRFCLSG